MGQKKNDLIVVAIGASAGGFESFKHFLIHLPADTGLSYIFIQHLNPNYESLSAHLLSSYTAMPVKEIEEGMALEPDHVYIAPSHKLLTLDDSILKLQEDERKKGPLRSIDFFFETVARDKQQKVIGIILSGSGDDGVKGCRAIKDNGGVIIAQDPNTALFNSMPQNLIETELADYILSTEKMPEIIQHISLSQKNIPYKMDEKDKEYLSQIIEELKEKTKNDFSFYKKATLVRRIHRRMELHGLRSIPEYYDYIENNPSEVNNLLKDILIKVTEFFRNPDSFKALIHNLKSQLSVESKEPFRVWIPGCATGEEAYTILMALMELAPLRDRKIQVFATDIDAKALDFARQGVFSSKIESQLSRQRLDAFFDKKGDVYRVKNAVREKILFTHHNILHDTPFSKLDLISCRNLLIYIEPTMQKELMKLFHFSLKKEGLLFLGNTETIGREEHLFDVVSKKHCIFKRRELATNGVQDLWMKGAAPIKRDELQVHPSSRQKKNFFEEFKQQLAEEFIPASVLINERLDVLYFFGSLNRYLVVPQGVANLNLLSMARGNLPAKLKKSIQKITHYKDQLIVDTAYIFNEEKLCWIEYRISFLKKASDHNLFIITFIDKDKNQSLEEQGGVVHYSNIEVLEQELTTTKAYLQSTIDSLESINEDLKISNEEIMSMNEELQSSNEEMETSKEELQSLNEELTVVNSQLQEKIEVEEQINNDLSNLIKSTDIATIFLDEKCHLKRFTPQATRLFNLRNTDLSRPLSDITAQFIDDSLFADIADALKAYVSREQEVQTDSGEWYLRKVLSYRNVDNHITGVVVTFSNVTSIKVVQELLKKNKANLRNVLDSLPFQIAYIDRLLNYQFINKAYLLAYNVSFEDLYEQPLQDKDNKIIGPYLEAVFAGRQIKIDDVTEDQRSREIILLPDLDSGTKDVKGFFVINVDITERKKTALALKKANDILEEKVLQRTQELNVEVLNRKEAESKAMLSRDFLKEVVNAVPDPMIVRDNKDHLVIVNQAFCQLVGKNEQDVLLKSISDIYGDPSFKLKISTPKKIFGKSTSQNKITIGEKVFLVEEHLFHSQQNERYVITSYRDITQMLLAEKELESTIKQLKATNKELNGYAYMCAHDLQEPTRAIGFFSQVLLDELQDILSDSNKKHLELILHSATSLQSMIKGALDYAKVTATTEDGQFINGEDVLHNVLVNLRVPIEENKAVITHDPLPILSGKYANIYLVLQNLISNALKFKGEESPIIHISVKKQKSGYVFSVSDNGIGIELKHTKRLFELFHRLKNDQYPGTGVGLAICKKIITSFGGEIWVTSEEGKGSTFYFSIPEKIQEK